MIKYKNQCQEQCQFQPAKIWSHNDFYTVFQKNRSGSFYIIICFYVSIFLIFYEHAISAFKLSIVLQSDVNSTRRNIKCERNKYTKHAYNKLVYKDITTILVDFHVSTVYLKIHVPSKNTFSLPYCKKLFQNQNKLCFLQLNQNYQECIFSMK